MLTWLQRRLIYRPRRERIIQPHHSGLLPGQVHHRTIETDDGHRLNGWQVLRQGVLARNGKQCDELLAGDHPVVLFLPGNQVNRKYRVHECGHFLALGADVFIFDYRGYGDNAGAPSEEGLARDARAAWTHLVDDCQIDPARVIVCGESLGGAVATRLTEEITQLGQRPAGLILRSTFSSLAEAGAHHYPWLPVKWVLVDRFPSIERIANIECPLLQIHGTADRVVPYPLGRRLFEAAPARSTCGVEKRFVEIDGANHDDILVVAPDVFRESIESFVRTVRPVLVAGE